MSGTLGLFAGTLKRHPQCSEPPSFLVYEERLIRARTVAQFQLGFDLFEQDIVHRDEAFLVPFADHAQ